ncbi:uncharacterized protein LOC114248488 [Bombyx mandarina]|uniref:Outer kinetochore Spc24 n=2 Tax=Bombyx TaxID=7090 RepID=A0A1W7HDB3_BOMMO|nr:uncharacterized protein LOC101735736 [Bombyx mori]XP_028037541.1 uncharacterized protein LOC114248488 [Bombyx mandarina]BAX35240.1 outer kinetochore Spc24 [Bombyx mori]
MESEDWCAVLIDNIDNFFKTLDDKIEKEQQQLKASRMKTELETKLAQETKVHNELSERLAELSRRSGELDNVCASLQSCLTIADSDKNRLENAKETYQLVKELTGVRLDFSAPPNISKGYIKNESRKVLQPFEVDSADSNALWNLIQSVSGDWSDKENKPRN